MHCNKLSFPIERKKGAPSSTKRNRNVSIWLEVGFVKKKRSYNIWLTLFKKESKDIGKIHNCLKNDDTNIWQKLIGKCLKRKSNVRPIPY